MTTSASRSSSIVVVRHGETDWNAARKIQGRTEVPLNDRGRIQAAEAAALLHETGEWERVITSPLGRAFETGRIIAEALRLPDPTVDPEILERDFGPAEGVAVPDAQERWPGLEVPGSESLDALARRGAEAFSRILHEQPGSIVVAHGALMRSALGALAGHEMPRVVNGELWLVEHVGAGYETAGSIRVRRAGAPSSAETLRQPGALAGRRG